MNVDEYIRSEVERQYSTKFDEFEKAYEYALTTSRYWGEVNLSMFLQNLARKCEPDLNKWRVNFTNLRLSEVGFVNGGKATRAVEVPQQFERLIGLYRYTYSTHDIDIWVKSLLEIHPWADGNGRTASIFRNWAMGTLDDPSPLPYYFQERHELSSD